MRFATRNVTTFTWNTNTYILMNSLLHTIYIIVNNIFFVSLSLSEALSQLMTVSYVHMLTG